MSCVGAADLIVKHLNYRNVGKKLLKLSVININSCDIYVRLREEEAGIGINYEREIHEEYVRKGLPDIYAPTHKLYVCNISTVVTKEKLKEHFNAKGFCPMYITLLMNEGQKKQYAYVSLETEDLAIEALTVLHYSLLCDAHLYIGFAPISNFKKR